MFNMHDVLPELYEEFPEIDEKRIEKICNDGLMGILRFGRIKEELIVRCPGNDEIKFFVPLSPANQHELINNNRMRRIYVAKQKANGQKSE